jgi:Na+/alanine symporter
MQAILDFFTGTLNTIAWMYILLPCVAIGGLIFTIRNRGVQFTKLGASLKLAVGKAFQKDGDKKG